MEFSDLSLRDSYESRDSSGSSLYAVSAAEATFYYSGISPSPPQLVFRTSKQPWVKPTGPEAYRHLKQLRPVYGHRLNDLWDTIGPQVVDLLDQQKIVFSSVDVVRFSSGTDEDVVISPVVLWIGVLPDSLGGEHAIKSANALLNLLGSHGIHDVDVEYRESVYRRSTGPELYAPVSNLDATKNVIDPLTTSLGLPISNARARQCQSIGTLGFYFAEGGESKDILAVTARHVLFPEDEDNSDYTRNTSTPRRDVLLMGTKAWHGYLQSVRIEIGNLGITAEIHEGSIEKLKLKAEGTTAAAEKAKKDLKETEELLRKTREAIDELEELYVATKRKWSKRSRRIIGHVVRSPRISVDTPPHDFSKDVAIIKLKKDRFKSVEGPMNVLDLGPEIDAAKFTRMMYPRSDTKPAFKYPSDRLLPLGDIIPEELLRRPDMRDINNEPCLFVTKRGLATKTTVGRATGIFSYVREYFPTGTQTSKEWAILPYDGESGAFAKGGDSGAVIVDRLGRFGGLLTGGAGMTASSDVTYAMPFFWLWSLVKTMYPNAHLCPVIE